jgi:hypothetical protein
LKWIATLLTGQTESSETKTSTSELDPALVTALKFIPDTGSPVILLTDPTSGERFIRFTRVTKKLNHTDLRVEIFGITKEIRGNRAEFYIYQHPDGLVISTSKEIYFDPEKKLIE